MKLFSSILAAALVLAGQAQARPAQARPVLVELFTSQACSSCPPADALLRALQQSDKGILPLSFNVTYWNSTAWTDKDSLDGATARQYWYAGLQHGDDVYTPEAVVDGGAQLVGSDREQLTAAINAARNAASPSVPVTVGGDANTAVIAIAQGRPAQPDTIWLFGFDASHTTQIGGGENGGATLTEVNVVRSITALGNWSGAARSLKIPRPAGAHLAVILQRRDGGIDGLGAS